MFRVFLVCLTYSFIFFHNLKYLRTCRVAAGNYLRKAGEIHGTVEIHISIGKFYKYSVIIIQSFRSIKVKLYAYDPKVGEFVSPVCDVAHSFPT